MVPEDLPDFIQQIAACEQLSGADQVFSRALAALGCDYFTYSHYGPAGLSDKPVAHQMDADFLQAWSGHYWQQAYAPVDVVAQQVRQSLLPVSWNLQSVKENATGKTQQLFVDAIDYGLQAGLSIPIHGPQGAFAIVVLHDRDNEGEYRNNLVLQQQAHWLSMHYHTKVSELLSQQHPSTHVHLTPREKQCLQLTAEHKTAKEVASVLGITPRTVGLHIENANHKLMTKNKYQSVAEAVRRGLI